MWPPCLCMCVGVRSILTERNRMTKDAWMSDRQGEHKCISAFSKEAPRELKLCSVEERKRSKWKSISWLTEISVIYNSSHWLLVCIFAALQFNREAHCILSPVESFSLQIRKQSTMLITVAACNTKNTSTLAWNLLLSPLPWFLFVANSPNLVSLQAYKWDKHWPLLPSNYWETWLAVRTHANKFSALWLKV